MVAYVLPTFNLFCNIWHPPVVVPPVGPPTLTVMCNLALGRRTAEDAVGPPLGMWLLLPALTDIRVGSVCEVPALSGRWYKVIGVDDAGKGFANEHRVGLLDSGSNLAWAVPYP